jgi:hypothetical protein
MDGALKRPNYAGMTVNERMSAAGIMDRFEPAARSRDREEMISLLLEVETGEQDARLITETILADPKKYGY